jgi:hypothetical protein
MTRKPAMQPLLKYYTENADRVVSLDELASTQKNCM